MRKSWLRRHRKLWWGISAGAAAFWLAYDRLCATFVPGPTSTWFSGFLAGAFVLLIVGARSNPPGSIANWEEGAYGEQATARALGALPEGWVVLHDLADGIYNIDHVVIGPSGVFCLNSKRSVYRLVRRDGAFVGVHPDDDHLTHRIDAELAGVRREAARVAELIRQRTGQRVWVQGVVVWWSPVEGGGGSVERAAVVAGTELVPALLRNRPRVVPDRQAIAEALAPGRHRRGSGAVLPQQRATRAHV